MKTATLLLAVMCCLTEDTSAADIFECLRTVPLRIRVNIEDGSKSGPRTLLLSGGGATPLRAIDAETGRLVWSAGATGPALQRFDSMTAGFAGSLAALDTDADGLHDRLYAGDLAGRIWRFDLHNGAPPDRWATGGVFADFSDATYGRAFLAAPDVSLSAAAAGAPWLNIAIGSASLSAGATNNRFYVLRDRAVNESWSAEKYRSWRPLRESDLALLDGLTDATLPDASPGYYFNLGMGQVLTSSITIAGRAVLAIAESAPLPTTGCKVPTSISAVAVDTGRLNFDLNRDGATDRRDWRVIQPVAVAANLPFSLTGSDTDPTAHCTLGDAPVPACDVDTAPSRTYWRREDAD